MVEEIGTGDIRSRTSSQRSDGTKLAETRRAEGGKWRYRTYQFIMMIIRDKRSRQESPRLHEILIQETLKTA